jgi:hypothetical protein
MVGLGEISANLAPLRLPFQLKAKDVLASNFAGPRDVETVIASVSEAIHFRRVKKEWIASSLSAFAR